MAQEQQLGQHTINEVWSSEWRNQKPDPKAVFGNRLFIEGYPIFKKYIPADAKTLLDVGSGTGRYGIKFAEEMPQAKVYVTDITEESLEIARHLAAETAVSNVVVQREDVNKLGFPDGTFDVVFCDVVIQHLPDPARAVEEMRRVLKPGGVLLVSVNNTLNVHRLVRSLMGKQYHYGYERSYTHGELRRLVQGAGLAVDVIDGFYPAYGIYRLKVHWQPFGLIGRILNRINRLIDPWTGRFFSRYFGFEIFAVGKK